jgi:hypothetical protein
MTDQASKNTVEVKNADDAKSIPATLKNDFVDHKDIPRDTSYSSPVEVVQNTKRKSTDIADEADEEEVEDAKKFGMDSGLESFLDQMNITKSQFFTVLSLCFGLLILIIVSFYFLFKVFGNTQEQVKVLEVTNPVVVEESKITESDDGESFVDKIVDWLPFVGKKEKVDEPADKPTEKPVENEEVSDDEKVDEKEEVSIPASEIGKTPTVSVNSSAIQASNRIGYNSLSEGKLAYFLATYRKVRNIFNTDLLSYLSQVPDRNAAFEAYLIQFKGANEEVKLAQEQLRQEIAELELRVDKLKEDAAVVENKFFDSLDTLNSETIQSDLNAFQEISRKRDLANSELKARVAIADRYKKALPAIETKIIAIEANKAPFVKGVQVIDFKQVDLDLIIQAE